MIASSATLRIAALLLVSAVFPHPVSAQVGDPPLPADGESTSTSDSGLITSVLRAGEGERRPALGDRVEVRYTGWLEDGTVFDSSERRGAGSTGRFVLGRVIAGWDEAMQAMAPGAVHKLTVPAELAYGDVGSPPTIPGGATLVFQVELVDFVSPPTFSPPDPDTAEVTESGLTIEVRAAGSGPMCTSEQIFSLEYAVWDRAGELHDATFFHGGTIDGRIDDMNPPFLREVPLRMRLGTELTVRVPEALGFPDGTPPNWGEVADGAMVWYLRLDAIHQPLPTPEFTKLDSERTETTASGLRYQVLEKGAGDPPAMGTEIRCHYAGWFSDGTLFDSSFPRGMPLEARVGDLIQGWNEALTRMSPGAVWRLHIPAALDYGSLGRPPLIPADAELIFHVELLEQPPEQPQKKAQSGG